MAIGFALVIAGSALATRRPGVQRGRAPDLAEPAFGASPD
jgi:hypothetical protein